MNNDANPCAGFEPSAAAGQEDLRGDFSLAGAGGRAARSGSVFGGGDQGAASMAFPPPWPRLRLNPFGPTFRAETQHKAADPTAPPLPEKVEAGEEEPGDPSTELLRRARHITSQAREDASSLEDCRQRRRGRSASRLGSGGQRDQPRVRGRTREEGSGSAGGSVAARRRGQTTCTRDRF